MANSYLNIPVPTPTQDPVPSAKIQDHVFAGAKLDEWATSQAETFIDRLGVVKYTCAGALKNISPLGKTYTPEQAASAITSGEIQNGAKYYQWATADYSVADEYINNSGAPSATGKFIANGASVLSAPNLIENSRAGEDKPIPKLLTGVGNSGAWAAAGSGLAAQGAVQSVLCPPRALPGDPTVNYLFTQDISFVAGGNYVAASFLFRGNTALIFSRVIPDTAATASPVQIEDIGGGIYRVTVVYKLLGVGVSPATVINFGCQQRGDSSAECEIAIPRMAISGRPIAGVGGDMSLADRKNIAGVVAPNLIFNSYADQRYQMPRLRAGSDPFVAVSTISNTTIATELASRGAVSCLVAPPVASGFKDALVEPLLDDTVFKGQWAAAQFTVYVAPGSGVDPKNEIARSAVFFIDVNGATTEVRPDVIERVSYNLFKVKSNYQYTADKPRRISMGVRQTSTVSTFYVFGFFLAVAGQPIRDIMEVPSRDTGMAERIDGNAQNIAFNPSGDPALQQQPVFSGSGVWTPIASLPTVVQQISQHGAKAAVPAMRATTTVTSRDGIVQILLGGVKSGDYVRFEFSVYVNADAGVDIPSTLTKCLGFFWDSGVHQVIATIKEKITNNIYVMTAQYQYVADATRVLFGVRNTLTNVDFYVFNTYAASATTPILNIKKGLVRDPMLEPFIDSKLVGVGIYPPVLALNQPITNAHNFILLPDRLFVPPLTPLLLQSPQMLMNWTQDMGQFLDWSYRGVDGSGRPYSYETNRTFEIDPAKLGTTVSVGFHDRQKVNQWSRRDVTLVRGPATGTASKRVSLIGDSLTNRGQSARVSALLREAGYTITEIGTMSQQESGTGEGRESWAASNFVGLRNVMNSQPIVISADKPSNINKNPFLFVATTTQLSANPSMCFLNTGATREQSYAETQVGTFYTFDYRRYLDQQGFSDPDVVSIALAWNDGTYLMTPAEYIAQIQYMVSQIKLACPNCIVAIAPYCHSYLNRARWNSTTSQYVRNVLGAFRGRQAEGLHVLPTWAVMPADTEFSAESSADRVIDSATGSYTDTRYDGIHWDDHGRQYSAYQCLYPFYAWACAQ